MALLSLDLPRVLSLQSDPFHALRRQSGCPVQQTEGPATAICVSICTFVLVYASVFVLLSSATDRRPCNSYMRQYLYFVLVYASCVSICTFALVYASVFVLLYLQQLLAASRDIICNIVLLENAEALERHCTAVQFCSTLVPAVF